MRYVGTLHKTAKKSTIPKKLQTERIKKQTTQVVDLGGFIIYLPIKFGTQERVVGVLFVVKRAVLQFKFIRINDIVNSYSVAVFL